MFKKNGFKTFFIFIILLIFSYSSNINSSKIFDSGNEITEQFDDLISKIADKNSGFNNRIDLNKILLRLDLIPIETLYLNLIYSNFILDKYYIYFFSTDSSPPNN